MMTVATFRRLASYPPLLQALVASPLLRNGYALVASAGLTSLLGLVFWGSPPGFIRRSRSVSGRP